jgi:hypothetical protein
VSVRLIGTGGKCLHQLVPRAALKCLVPGAGLETGWTDTGAAEGMFVWFDR